MVAIKRAENECVGGRPVGIIESSDHSDRECRSDSDFCQPPQLRLGLGLCGLDRRGPVSAGTDC
jgi:hypothetical protein